MTGHAIVIFGCAVRPDGAPSPALGRRIGYGLRAATAYPSAPILCCGAAGRRGPSEASVIVRELIGLGVSPDRLAPDEASRDTLQSVLAAARFVRERGLTGCIVCSEGYHLPRIRLMLAALRVPTEPGPLEGGGASLAHRMRMGLREAAAIPYDLAIVLCRRRS